LIHSKTCEMPHNRNISQPLNGLWSKETNRAKETTKVERKDKDKGKDKEQDKDRGKDRDDDKGEVRDTPGTKFPKLVVRSSLQGQFL
jgi:hypothetical protein